MEDGLIRGLLRPDPHLNHRPCPERATPRSPSESPSLCVVRVLLLMFQGERFGLFTDNWFMSVTMAVGSFIAGATSEGGGAVAFPVMTLGFKIPPHRQDFSR